MGFVLRDDLRLLNVGFLSHNSAATALSDRTDIFTAVEPRQWVCSAAMMQQKANHSRGKAFV